MSGDARDRAQGDLIGVIGDAQSHDAHGLGRVLLPLDKEGGETELYETTLAAFREQQRNWQPGQLNAVILVRAG
jgi:hypothetical protein